MTKRLERGGLIKWLRSLWLRYIVAPRTVAWQWSVLSPKALYTPEDFFWSTPPVESVRTTDRVLLCCTKQQSVILAQNLQIAGDSQVTLCINVAVFWESFFGEEFFLDRDITKPRLILATGQMRNYSYLGGETLPVRERLEIISRDFEVPLIML